MIKVASYCNHFDLNFDDVRSIWQAADRLGFDAAFTMDNSVGGVDGQPDRPVFDAWTILPALAAATSRVRIGPLVSPCRRRHPAVLAKMASTLDVISGGRLLLGMGCSDWPQLFTPWGLPFPPAAVRIAMLREELDIIKLMWSEQRADYSGKYYHLDQAVLNPKPIQSPRPDIWIGISHGRKLMPQVAAEHADGVNIVLGSDEESKERIDDVAAACREIGRDVDEITFSRHAFITLTDKPFDRRRGIEAQAKRLGKDEEWVERFIEEDDVYHVHLIGSVEQVAEGLRRRVLDLGFEYPVLQFVSAEAPIGGRIDSILASMETFAEDILPTL